MTEPLPFAGQIDLYFPRSEWEGRYDVYEVWRSVAGLDGPYELLHANAWEAARVPGGAVLDTTLGTVLLPLDGKSLQLQVNHDTPLWIAFESQGGAALSLQDAAEQVVAQARGLLSSYVSNRILVLKTAHVGLRASIRVTGGDAVPFVGLRVGMSGHGLDARPPLAGETSSLVDPIPEADKALYKTRYFNTSTGMTSDFSLPFPSRNQGGLSQKNLVRLYVNLVDVAGAPLSDTEILLQGPFQGTRIEGKTVAGNALRLRTDAVGHCETYAARGAIIRIAVAGTNIARELLVPDDPAITELDLLDPAVGKDDALEVQVPRLQYAVRRSI